MKVVNFDDCERLGISDIAHYIHQNTDLRSMIAVKGDAITDFSTWIVNSLNHWFLRDKFEPGAHISSGNR